MTISPSTTTAPPKRLPLPGSCHCGLTRYIIYLTIPSPFSATRPPTSNTDQEIYRCNCSTCHKMGFLHVHPAHPVRDFVLLAPLEPDKELGVYQCGEGLRKYYFCPKCGVRCLTFEAGGEGGVVELVEGEEGQIDAVTGPLGWGNGRDSGSDGEAEDEGKQTTYKRQVWRAKWDGRDETRPYLSVNGITIEQPQEAFDLRVLTEEKKVRYFDGKSAVEEEREARWKRPHYGGCY